MNAPTIEAWDCIHRSSLALAQDLVNAVDAAEDAEANSDADPERWNPPLPADGIARGFWNRAVHLAELLSAAEPGPFPPVVQDALDRTQAAAEVLQLATPGDHASP